MKTTIIQIGNSQGVILPPELLHNSHLSLESEVNVSVEGENILIKTKPRQGWAEAFKAYALSGEDDSSLPDVFEDEDLSEWTWEKE
jgi:antitoxin MazE